MLKTVRYKNVYQNDIDTMMNEIATEFEA